MSRTEVEKVRAQSKAGQSGPWVSHFEEMAKKTVIRRLFKYLPVSIEIARAVGMDEQAEAGLPQDTPLADAMTPIDAETGELSPPQPAHKTLADYRAEIDNATSAETAGLVLDDASRVLTTAPLPIGERVASWIRADFTAGTGAPSFSHSE